MTEKWTLHPETAELLKAFDKFAVRAKKYGWSAKIVVEFAHPVKEGP